MIILGWFGWGLSVLINLYMMVLFARVILDWSQFFARGWRPSGILLVLANVLYALTDPPIRWIGALCSGRCASVAAWRLMSVFMVLFPGPHHYAAFWLMFLYFMSPGST